MKKVLNILVEGVTEKDFVSNLIYPFLFDNGIHNVRTITLETSPGFKGGDIRYESRFKPNIVKIKPFSSSLFHNNQINIFIQCKK